MLTTKRHATKTVKLAKSVHVTAMAVNVLPVATAANAKSDQTCASRCRPLGNPPKLRKHQRLHRKQHRLQCLLSRFCLRHPPCNRLLLPYQ